MEESEKKIKESYIYDSSQILRKIIRRKNYIIISLILILIFMVGLNIYLAVGYKERTSYISSYHHRIVGEYKSAIANANQEMSLAVANVDNQDKLLNNLNATKLYLEIASNNLDAFSIFFQFIGKDDSINILSDPFFLAYTQVLQDWIDALNNEEIIDDPSRIEVELMAEDLNNLASKFLAYDYGNRENLNWLEELNPYELNALLIQLANETKTPAVKQNLDKVF